jgi:RsiW-degrading membrane proteinase PrsW (M82 family)
MDGIIYSIMVSMGFATLENINYVYLYGYGTAFIRMFLSVPAHASFAMVMGYYVGKAKFDSEKSFMLLLKGLAIAVLFHGLFDFFIFLQNSPQISQYLSDGLLFAGAVGSYYISMKLGMKLFRQHQQLSRQNFKKEENV